jgi:hypothetical protein
VTGEKDLIISDELNHASIMMGSAYPKLRGRFRHADMADLERILIEKRHQYDEVLIIHRRCFLNGGDIANLPEIVRLANNTMPRRMSTMPMVPGLGHGRPWNRRPLWVAWSGRLHHRDPVESHRGRRGLCLLQQSAREYYAASRAAIAILDILDAGGRRRHHRSVQDAGRIERIYRQAVGQCPLLQKEIDRSRV